MRRPPSWVVATRLLHDQSWGPRLVGGHGDHLAEPAPSQPTRWILGCVVDRVSCYRIGDHRWSALSCSKPRPGRLRQTLCRRSQAVMFILRAGVAPGRCRSRTDAIGHHGLPGRTPRAPGRSGPDERRHVTGPHRGGMLHAGVSRKKDGQMAEPSTLSVWHAKLGALLEPEWLLGGNNDAYSTGDLPAPCRCADRRGY